MAFIPQCKWYMDVDTSNNHVIPRSTMIPGNMCMACGKYDEETERAYINTMSNYPSYIFITCKSKQCVKETMIGIAHFYKTYGEHIMIFNRKLNDCTVERSNGNIESGWSLKGFYTSEEGVNKLLMINVKQNISKIISYEKFIELNPNKNNDLAVDINSYFMSVFNRLSDLIEQSVNDDTISISN